MKIALRVLTAITERRNPDESDLAELRRLSPDLEKLPPDELACAVIAMAIKDRSGN